MTKHFPGGGPQKDGEDPHFPYGKEQVYPGDNFEYHLPPFEAAFAAGTAQIMPYYGMPVGTDLEEVAFGFNKDVITGLLREKYGFNGVVCTDWGLLVDREVGGHVMEARAWGVEKLTLQERVHKAISAGVDQFGGEQCPEVIVELVRDGQIEESRIDESIRRLLRDKFRLGLFDNPYVDPDAAEQTVGKEEFRAAGELAQRKSIVLLKNGEGDGNATLPLKVGLKLYVEGVAPEVAGEYGEVVDRVEDADMAILRLKAPFEFRDWGFLDRLFHAGDLDFKEPEKSSILHILGQVPTVVDIYLDRPSVIPEIAEASAVLLANFGASDRAVLDVIFGRFAPTGKLPFEMPSSMEAVRKQKEDVPYDSENPLFRFGHGLSY
jgi:beta-glucosidase